MIQMIFPMITMQQNRKCIILLQECIQIYDSLGDMAGKAKATNNLGAAWSQNGSMDNALSCYLEVLAYYKTKSDSNNIAKVYMNLGLVYDRLKKFELAYDAATKARDIFVLKKDDQMVASTSVNIGLSLTSLKRYKEAMDCFTKTLNFYESDSNLFGLAVTTTNIAKIYKSDGDFQNARIWYAKSLPYIRMINNKWAEASLYFDLAEMDRAKGKWDQALINLSTANQINNEAGDQELQMQLFEAYYKVYDTLGQASQALAYFKKYVSLHDTLTSIEKSKRIEELSIRIELFQKNEENQLLKQDLKSHNFRQWIISGVFLFVFLICVLLIVILIQKRKNLLLKKSQADQEKLLREIETENIRIEKKMKEDELEKSQIEVQMKEQELVYQTLLRLDVTQVNHSVQEKLLPFQHKFSSKANQNDFVMAINEIVRDSGKDPLADFEFMFNQLHKSFIDNLMAHCSTLTRVELHICSLLRINLSTKDIARLLNISIGSVDMSRHRIRHKLALDPTHSLTGFLITL